MRFLVTGGLGFIGSNFIIKLLKSQKDNFIINIDAGLHGSNEKNLEEIKNEKKYRFIKGNINNRNLIEKLISESDIIINFAAESFVDRSIANVKPFLESNIMGVYNILEVIKKQKKRFIQISTDEVFGSLESGSANEKFRFNPSSPYASSKASAELIINSYNTTYDLDCIITRCTNNYGPRQFSEKLIPKVISLAQKNKKIPVYGSGKNIRDWIYVDEHSDAILEIVDKGRNKESYNISSKNELDNLSIIRKILQIMNKPEDLIEFVEDRPGHDFRYSLDSSKITNEIGWKSKISFEEGIEKTIKWYNENTGDNISDSALQKTPWKN